MNNEKPQVTRVAAYGLIQADGRLLLSRISKQFPFPELVGKWTLPGGGLEFGEDPADAMVREVFEETGLSVRPTALAGVNSDSGRVPGDIYHNVRIIYYAEVIGGDLRNEQDGSTDLCAWHEHSEVPNLELVDLVQTALPMVISGSI